MHCIIHGKIEKRSWQKTNVESMVKTTRQKTQTSRARSMEFAHIHLLENIAAFMCKAV
jgi:hypothetical protein